MKKKSLKLLALSVLFVLALSVSVFGAENEGLGFSVGEMYEIKQFITSAPEVFEADIYIDSTEEDQGVVFGNYYTLGSSVDGFKFGIGVGGVPTVTLHTAADTDTVIAFDLATIESGKWKNVKVELDRTEGAQKALCYIDGILCQTLKFESIPVLSGSVYQYVVGGDRMPGSDHIINPNHFRGKIASLSAKANGSTLFEFDMSSTENPDAVLCDLSGNGYDGFFSKQYLTKEELPARIEDYAYSFAVMGDPQYVAFYKPEAYVPMYEWIVEQSPEYVISLGDITDLNYSHEWNAAKAAIAVLDEAGIPHTHIKGNHDNADKFNENIPWSKYGHIFDGITAGAYAENLLNTWRTLEIGDTKWMIVGLEYEPADAVLLWASEAIKAHPDYNVIVATHDYLNRMGNTYKTNYGTWSKTTERLWTNLIDKHPNIVLTLCGHVSSDNVIVKTRENSCGATVTEMLIDFQSVDRSFDYLAMVTMFHFSKDGKTLQIENYSTDDKAYFKDINQFTISLNTLDVEVSEVENEGTPDYDLSSATQNGSINGYTWSVCGDTLVISGNSNSKALNDSSAISELALGIKKIVIENSTCIEAFGDGLFSGFSACDTVVIPAKLNKLGSKTFENMTSLTTVALYNEYYSADFAGEGIIDLQDINYFSSDSFSGSAANGVTVYMPANAIMSGEVQRFVSADSVTFYVYPSGEAADLVRDNLSENDTLKYYTAEMTGDARLTRKGTNTTDKGVDVFTWSFDEVTGKLTLTFDGATFGFRDFEGFGDWKKLWSDAVISIEVEGKTAWGKTQIMNEQTTGVYNGYKNLVSILFKKSGYNSTMCEIQVGTNSFGLFSDDPKLTSIGFGSLTEGVADISKIETIRGASFDEMFRGCSSLEKIILPSCATAVNLYTSTFEGCTSLKSVVLPSALTAIGANCFKDCSSLGFVSLPATLTAIDATSFGADMTLGTQSMEIYSLVKEMGYNAVIDVRTVALSDFALERTEGETIEVFLSVASENAEYSAEALSAKFGNNVKYFVYPTSAGASAVRELIKKDSTSSMVYYSEKMYSELTRSGENITSLNKYTWSFDEESGLLTFNLTNVQYQTMIGKNDPYFAWKAIWKDAIYDIYVGGFSDQITHQSGLSTGIFDGMPNLISITFRFKSDKYGYNGDYIGNSSSSTLGVFSNNPSLTTIKYGSGEDGVIDLSAFKTSKTAGSLNRLFENCTSITKVILPETAPKNFDVIKASMFKGCSSLETIVIPDYITAINANAFEGCTSLKNLVLKNSAVTVDSTAFNGADTKIICFDEAQVEAINASLESGETEAKAMLMNGAINAEGISIRYKDYNGLRYIFSFDNVEKKDLALAGFTLREYGILVSSATNMANAFVSSDSNGAYIAPATNIKKVAVYDSTYEENDGYSGKTLSISTAEKTMFAGTVTNFSEDNGKLEVYARAYAVYFDAEGNEYIYYCDYGDVSEEYKAASIFKVAYDMYKANAEGIRDAAVDEKAVWSILLLGADVEEIKETPIEGFENVTLTLVNDGEGSYLAFLKSNATVSEEAVAAAKEKLTASGYADVEVLPIVINK